MLHYRHILFLITILFFSAFVPNERVEKLKLSMLSQTLSEGKVITFKADLYYRVSNSLLVTHFTYPREIITITNAQGEFKNYNVKDNTVMQSLGKDFSSKQSFIYNFFSGSYSDMGLREAGFTMTDSKVDDGLIVSNWKAPVVHANIGKTSIELVHENRLPIYLGVIVNDTLRSKTFYTNYTTVNNTQVPLNITEIQYTNKGRDSIITRKKYKDLRINGAVEDTYFNFKIPSTAKLLETPGRN